MYKKLRAAEGKENEDQLYVIKKVLNKMKKTIKKVSEDRKFMIEEDEKIIRVVELIFCLNQLGQSGQGLKIILTPKQMFSRISISLAQLK